MTIDANNTGAVEIGGAVVDVVSLLGPNADETNSPALINGNVRKRMILGNPATGAPLDLQADIATAAAAAAAAQAASVPAVNLVTAAEPAATLAAQQIYGQGLPALYRSPWEALRSDFRGGNTSVWKTARDAGTARVAVIGHSIVEGDNQNFLGASFYNLLRRHMRRAFPDVTLAFENFGISGTKAGDFSTYVSTTNFSFAAPGATQYRQHWQTITATTASKLWRTYVQDWAPDIVFLAWDLNETVPSTFATNMQAIIDNIRTGNGWNGNGTAGSAVVGNASTKRPTIVLVACHTGTDTTGVVYQCSQIIRDLAYKNSCPLIDAARVYEILTSGIDPAGSPAVTGEFAFKQYATTPSGSGFLLDPTYWKSWVGTGFLTSGATVRDLNTGAALEIERYINAVGSTTGITDGSVQVNVNVNTAGGIPFVRYRADPTDANYAVNNTGQCYYVEIATTTLSLIYRASGGGTTTLGTLTLANGTGTNTVFTIRVDFNGGRHHVEVYAPTGEFQTLDVFDFSYIGPGFSRIGYRGTGGCFFNTATLGNKSQGVILERWDRVPTFGTTFTDAQLLGTTNDFTTNANSYGGNAVNHMTGPGTKIVYEPCIQNLLVKLAA